MSDTVIRVENLSKKYIINHQRTGGYMTLRDQLTEGMQSFQKLLTPGKKKPPEPTIEEFWALKDVSFEVKQGDRLGIIGRNGAGKSTLLKILSRITEPTAGQITVQGRVASLLEVGTGFHPELTGRENIFLNGAILGMSKVEIRRKFDEIVDFAEIEKFLDTPVKRYSSGMYVRLAFAVAAHLEPEVLIVDEVLAVGDSAFQRKCLGKMNDVTREGRTVLFVSHNMTAVEGLCNQAIWLSEGRINQEGQSRQVVSRYLENSLLKSTEKVWINQKQAPGNDEVRLRCVRVKPVEGSPLDPITVRTPFMMEFEYWNQQSNANLVLSLQLYNEQDILVFDVGRFTTPEWQKNNIPLGLFRDRCFVPADLLNNSTYRVELFFSKNQHVVYQYKDILVFDIQDSTDFRGDWYGDWLGVVRPILDWKTEMIEEVISQTFA